MPEQNVLTEFEVAAMLKDMMETAQRVNAILDLQNMAFEAVCRMPQFDRSEFNLLLLSTHRAGNMVVDLVDEMYSAASHLEAARQAGRLRLPSPIEVSP